MGIFKGVVERVEEERKRFYYNIIYEDGDREEWNEGQYLYGKEFREAIDSERCVKEIANADGTDSASSGKESDYSADREERERIKRLKKKNDGAFRCVAAKTRRKERERGGIRHVK